MGHWRGDARIARSGLHSTQSYHATMFAPNEIEVCARLFVDRLLIAASSSVLFALGSMTGVGLKLACAYRRKGPRKFCVKFLDPRRGLWRKVASTNVRQGLIGGT